MVYIISNGINNIKWYEWYQMVQIISNGINNTKWYKTRGSLIFYYCINNNEVFRGFRILLMIFQWYNMTYYLMCFYI